MKKIINILCKFLLCVTMFGFVFSYADNESSTNSESYIYYYGQGCAHCATLDRYLERNNAYELLDIQKKEVWTDKENNEEMLAMCQRLGLTESSIGVPLFVVTNGDEEKALIGDSAIISHIKPYLENGETSSDSKKTLVLVILGVLAIAIPVTIISLTNKKGTN